MALTSYKPSDTKTAGNAAIIIAPMIADLTAPTVAELDAGVAIQCAIRGWGSSTSVQKSSEQYLCDTEARETTDKRTRSLNALEIDLSDPKVDTDDVLDLLVEGDTVYLVERPGVAHGSALAAQQVVDVYEVVVASVDRKPLANNSTDRFAIIVNFDVIKRESFVKIAAD